MTNDNELTVSVEYRNSSKEVVHSRTYSLSEYTELLRLDLLRLITDVEDLVYMTNGNQSKEDWPDNVWLAFAGIKHKLLDKANDIGRLPQTIRIGDDNGSCELVSQERD